MLRAKLIIKIQKCHICVIVQFCSNKAPGPGDTICVTAQLCSNKGPGPGDTICVTGQLCSNKGPGAGDTICVTGQLCSNKGPGPGDTIFVIVVQLIKLSFPPQSTLSGQSDHVMTKCTQQDLHYTVHSKCSLLLILRLRRPNTASIFLNTNKMR
jgi:hypothetical protein